MALSPWRVLASSSARMDTATSPSVDFPNPRGIDVSMTVMRDGRMLANAPVHIVGPLGGLPPAILKADAGGRIMLTSATVPQIRVEVPGSDQIVVPLTGSRAVADFGLDRAE